MASWTKQQSMARAVGLALAQWLAWAPSGAAAQTALAEQALPAVTVKAEREVVPGTVVIGSDELEARQALDLRDALAQEPSVAVGGGGTAITQKVYVRGIEDTMLNVSVDGARQNGYIFHHQGRIVLDPQLLKSVEIEKGTGTATAGPGALAGALRMTTKDAADLLLPGQRFGGLLGAGVRSNDGWHASAALYGRPSDNVDLLGYVRRQDISNYEDGNGNVVPYSASEQDTSLFKFGWAPVAGQRVTLSYNGVSEEGIRYLRPHMVAFAGNNVPLPSSFDRDTFTAGWSRTADGGIPAIALKAYSDANTNKRTSAGRTYGEEVDSRGFDAELESRLGMHKLEYGLNYAKQDARALNPVRVFNPAFVNGATNSGREDARVVGVFLQDTFALSERWIVGAGMRYDSYDYTDNHGQQFSSDGFSPNASLTFRPNEAFSVRLAYSEALRGVGPKEAFLLDNGPGPHVYRNDANLRPEEASNIELGAEYKAGNWALRGSVYELTIDNFIEANFIGGQARRFNAGELKSRGYELAADWRQGVFTAGLGVAHAKPRLNGQLLSDANFGLGTASGRSWSLNLGYALPAWNLDLGWSTRMVEDLDTLAGATRYTKDGYTVHDLYATWLPRGTDTLQVRFAIKNLLDRFYYDQATYALNPAQNRIIGLPEPGRDLRVEVSWKF